MPSHAGTFRPESHARLAGALYTLIIVAGIGSEFALRGPLRDAPDPAAAIAAAPGTFRLSLAGDLVMLLADVALALLFFALLRRVSEDLSRAAMVFRLMQAALIGAGLIALAAVPGLAVAGEKAAVARILALHATGYDIALAFFAVNTALIAWLTWAGGRVPLALGMALAGAATVYLVGAFLRLLAPDLIATYQPAYVLPLLAETGLALWLLVTARI